MPPDPANSLRLRRSLHAFGVSALIYAGLARPTTMQKVNLAIPLLEPDWT